MDVINGMNECKIRWEIDSLIYIYKGACVHWDSSNISCPYMQKTWNLGGYIEMVP